MIIVAHPPFAQQFNIFKALSGVSYTYNVSLSGTFAEIVTVAEFIGECHKYCGNIG